MIDKPLTESTPPAPSPAALWTGRVLSVLPCLMLFMSAGFKLAKAPMVVEGFTKIGIPEQAIVPIGAVELACTILYLIPQTAVLGAILLTGYLGGAVLVHVIQGQGWYPPFIFGVVLWTGLYLRDPRLRALAPLRSL